MSESPPRLRPTLRLWDLIFYGIVIITPIAPVPIFGVVQQLSHGHAVTTVLLAGVAMILTAFSYGRMAAIYPAVGSAYTYVGRGLNPHLGFLAGWAMLLDYLVLPAVALIQAGLAFERLIPAVPYVLWIGIFALLLTLINLRGISTTARTNIVLLAVMSVVIFLFLLQAVRYLFKGPGLFSLQPFYSPEHFDAGSIATATSFAALTYIGFDGVTTLAEEVENPRRNLPLATICICMFTTVLSGLLVYLAQLIWPDYRTFPSPDTAFLDVTERVGGAFLFHAMGLTVAIASLGGGLSAQVAAARVLFAMGRDNVLPRQFFGRLSAVGPVHNILFVAVLASVGALVLNLEHAGELLNFGAFLAFMGVNAAAFQHAVTKRFYAAATVSALGFVFCFAISWNLPLLAKAVGGLWFLGGLIHAGVRTRGFRIAPADLDFSGG
jgi:amino acid transporter